MADIKLTKSQAKRFLLDYHGLSGDFRWHGSEGIMAYIRRVGCIQFDPLNVVGMNPELVLQSRVKDFRRDQLYELLYLERRLVDYWDKNLAIFPLEDWPYFRRHRNGYQAWCDKHEDTVKRVYDEIRMRGALSSGDLQYNEKIEWAWGPTRLSRAALEGMYHAGQLVIHHKTGTRKFYDLAERHIPSELFDAPDPFLSYEQFYDWYVLRRIGSVGLLWNRPSDAWLCIRGLKSTQRKEAFRRLHHRQQIIEVEVEGLEEPLYIRSADADLLARTLAADPPAQERASILAPLDNLLWDRNLIQALFDFEYRWEVYKPVTERKYGYYVLPVLYGDTIVARFEPQHHKKNAPFTILNWWWEPNVDVTGPMKAGIRECLERFASFLGTSLDERSSPLQTACDIF